MNKKSIIIFSAILAVASIFLFEAIGLHRINNEKAEAQSELRLAKPSLNSYTDLWMYMAHGSYVGLPSFDSVCNYSGRDVAAYRVDITVCEEKNFPPSDTQLYKDLYVMRIKENPKYDEWRVSFPEIYENLGLSLD